MVKNKWKEENDSIIIDVPAEFDFRPNLDYLLRDKNEIMYKIKDKAITRLISANDKRMLVQISAPNNHNLHVRFLAGTRPKSVKTRANVVNYIRDWFDLDTNLAPFYEIAQTDPLLKHLIQDFFGLRLVGLPDLFEALCWGVLGQQINLGFAYTLKRQFVEKFGDAVEYNGENYWVFPSFEKIAKLTIEDMSEIKMTVRKSEYIIGIAKLMASGELSKEKLLELDDFKKIEKELVKIRGIGPWTANYVLMRCLRYLTAFPIADVGLQNAIKSLKNINRKPTKEEILEIASTWKGWEAYATFYLWRVSYNF
ncbi:DNA-3-methyladenine glycosylase [Virgibacillus profundi]|uniref:DNA-3-methyladenine glycosylase II n=1 Tax=Virgibacillus profundi TaxID=2024555 RepID=A0A2A2IK62_9BACI|nr:DNA-3-methyladenine glycosylase [Virgibacillus profundi]PAV31696.1 DNA-3-methyladenine glycosylase [Virgibacillus profundi]PXY55882.1 DNA-3-methyladenine glycosylase 2 family protein [Virgibacillus profundi]